MHQPGKAEPLWNRYIRPQVELLLAPFHTADATALAYFYRFHRFLVRENLLSRFGSSEKEASGFAAAWQCTTAEKREWAAFSPISNFSPPKPTRSTTV